MDITPADGESLFVGDERGFVAIHIDGDDGPRSWTASGGGMKMTSVVYDGRIFLPKPDGELVDVTDRAPGPDGVLCAYGCDAWSISDDCDQHRNS